MTTKWICLATRGHWDQLQRYRFVSFFGHAFRLSDDHLLGDMLRWRSDAWCRDYRNPHAKWGGAAGRRPADLGNAMQTESRIQDLYSECLRRPAGEGMLEILEGNRDRSSWSALAFQREEYRTFAKWAAFVFDIADEARAEQHGGADRQ